MRHIKDFIDGLVWTAVQSSLFLDLAEEFVSYRASRLTLVSSMSCWGASRLQHNTSRLHLVDQDENITSTDAACEWRKTLNLSYSAVVFSAS